MTPEQKRFLSRRFRDASEVQPELKRLKLLLLRFGGELLVAPPKPDPDIPGLLESGFLISGTVVLKQMMRSSCHQNISALWSMPKRQIIGIATGYALSEDGLWRQHTWGLLRNGILETTETRLKYFGILLQGEKADRFSQANRS
jgi:hypothetical protein